MKILHGNIEETSESLKWNSNPPTACHVVAALAMSRDVKTNFWTPRTIDQVPTSLALLNDHHVYLLYSTDFNTGIGSLR